jgi:hypothetical protein
MNDIRWHDANENNDGVKTVAIEIRRDGFGLGSQIVGYNGILKGNVVTYQGKKYIVVMVSRLGDFGLSETGGLPYKLRVRPDEVTASSTKLRS